MGAGASTRPATEEEALAAGYSSKQIARYKGKLLLEAAKARPTTHYNNFRSLLFLQELLSMD